MEVGDIIQATSTVVRRHLAPNAYALVLFGSHAKGDAYPTSDVDIGIVGREPVPFPTMTKILEEKDEIPTLRKIDLVDLQAMSDAFRENVLSYAKRL